MLLYNYLCNFSSLIGDGQFGSRSVSDLARDYVQASSQNLCKFQPPRVTFAFFDGITESVASMVYNLVMYMNNHIYNIIYSTLLKIQERKADRSSKEIEQTKKSQNTHKTRTDM